MPRSALLCLKIEIWAVTDHLGLELECSRRKNRAAAKKNFATAPFSTPWKRNTQVCQAKIS